MTRNVTWKERAVPGKAGGCPFPRLGAAGGRSYFVYKSFKQSLNYPHSLDISFYYTNTCNKAAATASHSLLNNFFIIIARGRKSPGILPFWGDFFFFRRFFSGDFYFWTYFSFLWRVSLFQGGFSLFQGDSPFSRGIYPFPGGFILFQRDLSFSREILPFPQRFSLSRGGFRLAGTVLCDTMETSKQRKRGRKRKWISEGSWSARRRRGSWG